MAGGTVQSVERAFAVLQHLARSPAGVTDVARAVHLPVSTVARLLGTLESLGAVSRPDGSAAYEIGAGLRALAGTVDPSALLVARARPVLAGLVERTGETSGLSVAEGGEVVYLDHVEARNEVTVRDWTGTRLPLHVVSSGLVLLAGQPPEVVDEYLTRPLVRCTSRTVTEPAALHRRLAAARHDGHVWTIGEFDDAIASVAAPVVDHRGATVAALHCHGPTYRFPGDTDRDAIAAHVTAAAQRLSHDLEEHPR
jgi:DNA-binding IclR family transcriptional regulator